MTSSVSPSGPGTTVGATAGGEADAVRDEVRRRYAAAAERVTASERTAVDAGAGGCSSCCEPTAASTAASTADPITSEHYSADEAAGLPAAALQASLGCGNPTALAELHPGETVLDLGSGGGIDVLLSARRVGPTGFAYGLDMTDEMLALAEANRRRAGAENVKFLKGTIEQIPLPDNSVDVIISNCVINLSTDKDAVFREAFRVLKPGGRFAVSDIVVLSELPAAVKQSLEAWAGCVAGALHERDYRAKLRAAGFVAPEVQLTRRFGLQALAASGEGDGDGCCAPLATTLAALSPEETRAADGAMASAFVRATKPARA
ncbi:MAG TPA: arsenite methyltransferase [Chloroflexota bacterium]|nr:arsenite methyltransferase [Chloroflexota bacterium]